MDRGLYEVSRSMHANLKNMEIVSNNLANINTVGYKSEVPFSEYLSRMENKPMKQLSNLEEGSLLQTNNKLDFAITGNAYFMIKTEKGIELTRDGRFSLTSDGKLVTNDGYDVITKGGGVNFLEALTQKDKEIVVTENGEIKVGEEILDQFSFAKIEDQQLLRRSENGRFFFANQTYELANDDEYKVKQGYLEESNTNPFLEIQEMISIHRDFESAQRAINSIDFMLGKAKDIGTV